MARDPDLKVLTWLWQQNPPRHDFNAEKVNKWAAQMRKHLTIPHRLACVTDIPEGLDSDIEVIPLPKEFRSVRVEKWSESSGAPQCYVRLNLWHPNAREIFGSEWLVSMDCDMIAIRNLDSLFSDRSADVRLFNGTGKNRPYNGGLVMLKAGARPHVYEEFAKDPTGIAKKAREVMVGSDQAVIGMLLGRGERTFTEADGVYYYSPRVARLNNGFHSPPENLRMLFFPGSVKPWNNVGYQWMRDAWDGLDVRTEGRPIYVYDDREGWGAKLEEAAIQRSVRFNRFSELRPELRKKGAILRGIKAMPANAALKRRLAAIEHPPMFDGVVFVRIDSKSRGIVAELKRHGVPGIVSCAEEMHLVSGERLKYTEDFDLLADMLLRMADEPREAAA